MIISGLFVVVAACLVSAPVSAQNYPIIPVTPTVTSPTSVPAGPTTTVSVATTSPTSTNLSKTGTAQPVVFVVSGLVPGERVTVTFDGASQEFIVGSDGVLRGTLQVSGTSTEGSTVTITSGTRRIQGVIEGDRVVIRGNAEVVLGERAVAPAADPQSSGSTQSSVNTEPAFTGSESVALLGAGAVLAGVGSLLTRVTRRRRTNESL